MSQTVVDASGVVHEFPDEATPEMMSQALGLGSYAEAKAKLENSSGVLDPSAARQWSFPRQIVNGLTLGHGPEAVALTGALTSNPLSASENYPGLFAQATTAKAAYQQANPAGAELGNLVGSTPTTAAALMATGGAGGVLADAAAASAPPLVGPLAFAAGKGGQSLGMKALSSGVQGGIEGLQAGVLQHDLNPDPGWGELGPGTVLNALAGGLSPLVWDAITPAISPTIARTALAGSDLGVDLTLPQIVQNGKSGVRPGGSTGQLQAYTRALSRTMGGDTPVLDEGAMTDIRDQIQSGLNGVASRTSIPVGEAGLVSDLTAIRSDSIRKYRGNPSALDKVNGQIDNILDILPGGINGDNYQEMTSKGGDIQQLIDNKETRGAGIRLRGALDDALARHAAPEDVAQLGQLRNQWKNMMTLQPAVEKSASGLVNPRDVAPAVANAYSDYAFTGAGDIGTLSEIGKLLPPAQATGEAKAPGHKIGLKGTMAGAAALGAGGAELAHILPDIGGLVAEHPGATIGAALSAALLAGGKKAYTAITQSQPWRNMMINNTLGSASGGVPYVLAGPLEEAGNALGVKGPQTVPGQ